MNKKLLTVLVAAFLCTTPAYAETGKSYTNADLANYSAMNMDVYMNSRVTSIKQAGNTGFVVEGYMFENGSMNANYSDSRNWREIVFVSADNVATTEAYRMPVTPKYNTWLNNNMTATQSGKYALSYANYSVTVNVNSMRDYATNSKQVAMKTGTYYVYMRISNGSQSYLFPLRDATLSDGTNMENSGTLPSGFTVYDSETRALAFTVTEAMLTGTSSETTGTGTSTTTPTNTAGKTTNPNFVSETVNADGSVTTCYKKGCVTHAKGFKGGGATGGVDHTINSGECTTAWCQ